MRSLIMTCVTLCLLMLIGCEKQEVQTVHVGMPQPPRRPMSELKPVEPAKPAEPAESEPAVATEPAAPAPPVAQEVQPAPTATPQPATASAAPQTYTVRKNDTLWSIAKKYLGDGRRWREIVAANDGLDPAKLMPGQTIKLPQK